jgi:uncharacterized glyoxalase superfamily protein PhnB
MPKFPRLKQINLVARDFETSLAFYRLLGLEIEDHSAPDRVILHASAGEAGEVDLEFDNEALSETYNAGSRRSGSRAVLINFAFETRAAVDAKYAELIAAGHPSRQRPYDTFWGARMAIVADPDGNDVALQSPSDPARRKWPPEPAPE